jgi:hypothetical integral membrane protein (TIGR02206 family)
VLKVLALVQLLNALAVQAYLIVSGRWEAEWALPCHLCDAAIAALVLAAFRPAPVWLELTYFWGLGGALQGLITPAIDARFPEPQFLTFFVVHVGLVTAAVFVAFGIRMTPRPNAPLRMLAWTNAFALLAGFASWLTGGNYMFLREPPPTGSILDGWPWYILWGEVLAFVVFVLLNLPFRLRRVSV